MCGPPTPHMDFCRRDSAPGSDIVHLSPTVRIFLHPFPNSEMGYRELGQFCEFPPSPSPHHGPCRNSAYLQKPGKCNRDSHGEILKLLQNCVKIVRKYFLSSYLSYFCIHCMHCCKNLQFKLNNQGSFLI